MDHRDAVLQGVERVLETDIDAAQLEAALSGV